MNFSMTHQIANPLQQSLDRLQNNPLLGALPAQLGPLDLARALRHRPISPEHVTAIPRHFRTPLTDQYKRTFIPTRQTLAIGNSLQRMLYDGLARRDPNNSEVRKFIYVSGQLKGKILDSIEWFPIYASGMVIEGITGTGKSHVLERYLSLLPQVIEHGLNEGGGWSSLRQLVWLRIHMPADGSRGGLLLSGLLELDRALGTTYATQFQGGRWTVEKLLVIFLHLLAVHRCGLLVIEEAQEKNLSQGSFGREFVTFFLRLLNWGVPTVLVGNPLAFDNLRQSSQDVDRFSEGGWFHLDPIMDPECDEWRREWLPGLWTPTLLDQPDEEYAPFSETPLDQSLAGFVWRRTAGCPRYVCRLRVEVQDHALRTGATTITPSMVDDVYRTSPKMGAVHSRIDALVNKDWRALAAYADIPSDYYRRLWNPKIDESADQSQERKTIALDSRQSMHERTTKTKNPASKPRLTKSTPVPSQKLSSDDIRSKEYQDKLIRELSQASGLGTT